MIPKIIHHFAPKDKNLWHPVWKKCIESWFLHFPKSEYEHKFWDDKKIENFVLKEYSEYKKYYNSLFVHIMQLDFARYLIINKFGGLYADMDIFCYKNFYDILNKDIILLESPHKNEIVQNCMFGGTSNNIFFNKCIDQIIINSLKYKINGNKIIFLISLKGIKLIHEISGSVLLSNIYLNYDKEKILVLNKNNFNPDPAYYDNNIITKHFLTGSWGKDCLLFKNIKKGNMNYDLYIKKDYNIVREIDIDNFDFYKNYFEK